MKYRVATIFTVLILNWGVAVGAQVPSGPRPQMTDASLAQGAAIYLRRCSFCHGLLGDGNGPAADFLDPRPRDFTLGTFKFRTTQSGELPRDEDLFRTVSRGLSGTAMQAFDSDLIKNGLSENERWAVIDYIKTFAVEFEDPELDPVKNDLVVTLPSERPAYSEALVAKGKEVFEHAKCWECHGKLGRGDGQKSFDRTDDWGFPIRIRNVTHPWKIKAGSEAEDIYMRFSTGINGTPMPSFVDALTEQERWALANFIKSLQHQPTGHQVLRALEIEGEISNDPREANWLAAEPMDVRLTGQVIAAPRWQNPSIELATVRALYNLEEIAFLIEWDDPFKDELHQSGIEFDPQEISRMGAFNSYVAANDVVPRQLETFRDAIALQFPVKLPEGTKKPHFFRGDSSNPVHLWQWRSDEAVRNAGQAVQESNARGWKQPAKAQSGEQQQVNAVASWNQGRWSVIMRRPLLTDDHNDIQFVKGRFIPLALNAWDGSNGEHGLIMSLSTWHSVILEAPVPIKIYLYTLLAVLASGALGLWLVRKERRRVAAMA